MKKLLVVVAILFIALPAHAKIGKHNFLMAVGGNYNLGAVSSDKIYNNGFVVDMPYYLEQGGGITAEIGYLLSDVTPVRGIVNVMDIRVGFSSSWSDTTIAQNQSGRVELASHTMTVSGMFTYGLGFTIGGKKRDSSRFVFDILGFGYSSRYSTSTKTLTYTDGRYGKSGRSVYDYATVDYLLPGAYYMGQNGLVIGVRNIISLSLDTSPLIPSVSYETTAYFGYALGK